MKLKRILSGFLAGAVALSSMVFSGVTASAVETITISGTEIAYADLITYDTITVNYSPKAADECSHGASHGDVNPTNCIWCGVAICGAVLSNGADTSSSGKTFTDGYCSWWKPSNYFKAAEYADSTSCTATVSVTDIIASFTSDPGWSTDFTIEKIYLSAQDCTLNSATATPADTTVYTTQNVPFSVNADGLVTFNGTFDASKASGANARIEITITPTDTWAGAQLLGYANDGSPDYNNIIVQGNDNGTGATTTLKFKFSDFNLPEKICFNTWKCTVDSIVIYNAETADEIFTEVIPAYTITIADTENGTVEADVAEAKEGDTVTVTATPDKGYELDTLTVTSESGTSVEVSDDNTFVMPGEGVKVAATFKKSVYNVTVATATNGTVSVDKTTASMGDTVTITATPAEDYELASLSVTAEGGADIEVSDDNTFVMPADNVKVSASFSAKDAEKFTVTVETPVNGTAKANVTEAAEGTEVTISATPNDGYELDAITVKTASGTAVTVTNGKFTMPAENVTVTVTFAEKAPEATGYDKVEANFDADTIVAQKATNADGTTNVRIVKMVKESDIANKGTVTFTLKNKAGTVKTVTSKNYYMSLVASGNKVEPKNGYVFLAITVTDIPEGEEVICTDITLS